MKQIFILTSLTFLWVQPLIAQISVDDSIVIFEADRRPVSNIKVSNNHSENDFFIKSDVYEVTNPGLESESRENTRDVRVTPKKFSLDKNSSRLIRIVKRSAPPKKEKIYRITLQPETDQSDEQSSGGTEKSTKVNMVTSMGVLVIVPPATPAPSLKWVRKGKIITFKNDGNTNVILRRQNYCVDEKCYQLPGRRIYVDNEWEMVLPQDLISKDVTFNMQILDETHPATFSVNGNGVVPSL